jgi:hypothetical protein
MKFEPYPDNRIAKIRKNDYSFLSSDYAYFAILCKHCGYDRGQHYNANCPDGIIYAKPDFPAELLTIINKNVKVI